jgi:hypothetical protein
LKGSITLNTLDVASDQPISARIEIDYGYSSNGKATRGHVGVCGRVERQAK